MLQAEGSLFFRVLGVVLLVVSTIGMVSVWR